jgi:hypothetical protein
MKVKDRKASENVDNKELIAEWRRHEDNFWSFQKALLLAMAGLVVGGALTSGNAIKTFLPISFLSGLGGVFQVFYWMNRSSFEKKLGTKIEEWKIWREDELIGLFWTTLAIVSGIVVWNN